MGKILNIAGKWYIKGDLPSLVCNHRFGKNCSYSEGSDNYSSDAWYPAEASAFKYNMPLHNFVNTIDGGQIYDAIQETGRMQHDMYFPTDRWKNPDTGVIEIIPDYYETVWSSAGEEFFNVTAGNAKAERYPNHGQEIYDLSAGNLGYDFNTATEGTSEIQELYGMAEELITDLYEFTNRLPTAFSFRNGRTELQWLLKNYFLSGRTSGYQNTANCYTAYGFNWLDKVTKLGNDRSLAWTDNVNQTRESATRWRTKGYLDGDNAAAYEASTVFCLDQLDITKNNSGWFHDFVHWAFIYPSYGDQRQLYYGDYLSQMSTYAVANDIHIGGYGELSEYFALRSQINKVVINRTSEGFRFTIDRSLNTDFESVNDSLLNTPISIAINLAGTAWQGQELKPSTGVISIKKIAADEFVVQIDKDGGYILDDATGIYLDEAKPVITTDYTDGILTINTDVGTKIVVWESPDANFYHIDTEHLRDNNQTTVRAVELSAGRNIFIGAIAANGQSSFKEIII